MRRWALLMTGSETRKSLVMTMTGPFLVVDKLVNRCFIYLTYRPLASLFYLVMYYQIVNYEKWGRDTVQKFSFNYASQ